MGERALRFIAPMPRLSGDPDSWRAQLQEIENHGFSTVAVSDHLARGWQMDAWTALSFAAGAVSRLRLLTLVLNEEMYHPARLAKAAATLDVLSGGRVELGLGAGWMPEDFAALGMTMSPARDRVERLASSLELMHAYRHGGDLTMSRTSFTVEKFESVPQSLQQPGVPIMLGAGGPRMLKLAGRYADIVGIHAPLGNGGVGSSAPEFAAESVRARIRIVEEAADAAGRPPPEIQFSVYDFAVGTRRSGHDAVAAAVDSGALGRSPVSIRGSERECIEQILEWSECLGITYWKLGSDVGLAMPIVDALKRSAAPSRDATDHGDGRK